LRQQDFITNVTYISKEQARKNFVNEGGNDVGQLEAIDALEGQNPFPASLRVNVTNPDQLDRLDQVFESSEFKKAQNPNPSFQPTSQSDRRESIDNIAQAAAFTERTGLVLSIVAVTISVLIIFNTIRMAIFNRRDEIQMMKLIGANKSFIQGPFIVEAVMYGLFAALVASAIVFPFVLTRSDYLNQYGVVVGPSVQFLGTWAPVIVLALMLVGALIGVVSSLLAVRRYLKV
jgi:cell division transport system permease protein